jgi:hypothetical protein
MFTRWQVIRWKNDLSPQEERSVPITLTEQFNQLSEESLDISNLFRVLSFLDSENVPTEMLVDGAKEWLRSQNEVQHAPSSSTSQSPSNPTILQRTSKSKVRERKEANADTKSSPDG